MITPNMRQLTPSVVVAQDKSHAEPVRRAGQRVSVPAVWREALAAFGDNAPPIVLFALVGFAGPAIVCILLSAVLRLDFYGQASGPFATWLGISTLQGGPVNPVSMLVVWVQAGLGAVGLAVAHVGDDRRHLQDALGQFGLAEAMLAVQMLADEIAEWMAHGLPCVNELSLRQAPIQTSPEPNASQEIRYLWNLPIDKLKGFTRISLAH